MTVILFILALSVATVVGLVWLLRVIRRSQRFDAWKNKVKQQLESPTQFHQRMDELGQRNVRKGKSKYGAQSWTLEWKERLFAGHFVPGGEGPSSCKLTTELEATGTHDGGSPFRSPHHGPVLDTLPHVVFRKESKRDRFGKRLGLNREVQTGDERFDSLVYVESNASDEDVTAIVSIPEVRESILDLLELGCSFVGLNHQRHSIILHWFDTKKGNPMSSSGLEHLLDDVHALAGRLPPFSRLGRPRKLPRGAGILIANALLFALMIPIVLIGRQYPPIGDGPGPIGTLVAAVAFVAVIIPTWLRVRGRATGLRFLFWNGLVMLVGYPLLAIFALYIVNGAFTESMREQTSTVVRKWSTTSDNSTSYYIRVEPWPPHEESPRLRIPRPVWRGLDRGNEVTLRVGGGALGYEWFDEVVRRR